MSKQGFEYTVSRQKLWFDRTVANALMPAANVVGALTRRSIDASDYPELETIYEQLRIGENHNVFSIDKFQTLVPSTKDVPLSRLLGIMRRLGLDELAQVRNIRDGSMSVCSHRPLIPEEFDEAMQSMSPRLRNQWREVTTHKPGGISSYAIYHHIHPIPDANEADLRATLDIQDKKHDSFAYSVQLIGSLCATAIQRRFL